MAQKTKTGKKFYSHTCWPWVYYTHITYDRNSPADWAIELFKPSIEGESRAV